MPVSDVQSGRHSDSDRRQIDLASKQVNRLKLKVENHIVFPHYRLNTALKLEQVNTLVDLKDSYTTKRIVGTGHRMSDDNHCKTGMT